MTDVLRRYRQERNHANSVNARLSTGKENDCWFFHRWKYSTTFYRSVFPTARIEVFVCTNGKCTKRKYIETPIRREEVPYH